MNSRLTAASPPKQDGEGGRKTWPPTHNKNTTNRRIGMSKRKNSTYARIKQSSRDTLTSRLVVYSTVHHKLHKKPLEEVTMSFAEVTKMLGDFGKAIDQDKLIADRHATVPVTIGKQSGFVSVSID